MSLVPRLGEGVLFVSVVFLLVVGVFPLFQFPVFAEGPVDAATLSTTEGSGVALFVVKPDLPPKDYGTKIYFALYSDGQSILPGTIYDHNNTANMISLSRSGHPMELEAYADGGDWYVRHITQRGRTHEQYTPWQKGGFSVAVAAANDDQIEGEHESTITIGYGCDTELKKLPVHTIHATITNTITDNDIEGSVDGVPMQVNTARYCMHTQTDWEYEVAVDQLESQESSDRKNVGQNKTNDPADESYEDEGDYLLNKSERYTSGEGEAVWLKVDERVRFFIDRNDAGDEHTITVKDMQDNQATVIIASDPFEATLQTGESKKFDVDGDGTEDIAIRLLGIENEEAGLEVRPLGEVVRVADTTKVGADTSKEAPLIWPYVAVGLVVVGGAVAFLVRSGMAGRVWRSFQLRLKKDVNAEDAHKNKPQS